MDSSIFGSVLIADLVATFLFGIACVQTVTWFKTSRRVPTFNKFVISTLWTIDALHTFLVAHFTYYYLVGVPASPSTGIVWSNTAVTGIEILLSNLTQILYAVRLWQLKVSPVQWLFPPLVILMIVHIFFNIYVPVRISELHSVADFGNPDFLWVPVFEFGLTSLIDLVLSICLIYSLAISGRRLGWTDSVLKVYVAYSLNTGILAGLFSLTAIIAYLANPDSLLFFAFKIVGTEFYVNSFLAMMNARYYLQRNRQPSQRYYVSPATLGESTIVTVEQPKSCVTADFGRARDGPQTINEVGLPLFPSVSEDGIAREAGLSEISVFTERRKIFL